MNYPPFTLTPYNQSNLLDRITKLDPTRTWEVIIREKKSKRSLEQNSRYWQLLTDFGKHLGYSSDEMHDLVRFKFMRNRVIVGDEPMPLLKSTTKLNTAEMAELQENIERWAASLGYIWQPQD